MPAGPHPTTSVGFAAPPPSPAAARSYCRRAARSHYENFLVATFLLPAAVREDLYVLYAYCRHVDDLGDEAAGDRLALLDEWEEGLRACFRGAPRHPIFVALADTVHRHNLPATPFHDLIRANRMDQTVRRYATRSDVLHYCRHSANPVGRLVLRIFGYDDPEMDRLSDATCTALQLANFWQDARRDLLAGRVYVPEEDMAAIGVTPADLAPDRSSPALRTLFAREVSWARDLFYEGVPLVDRVTPPFRIDLALFTLGGLSILDAVRRNDFDALVRRPTIPRRRQIALLARAAWRLWRGARGNDLPGLVPGMMP